ncbi:MAG: hypothetical protein K0B14_10775 [Anaerolineaceae bacterium]|nr:hypothetical protein [Anaerolineaceae bacterium]
MIIIGWIRDTCIFGKYNYSSFHTCYYTPDWYFRGEEINLNLRQTAYFKFNCVVLDVCRVTIDDRSVIGAGSVVVKDIPAGVFAADNPCRVIRELE